MFVFYSITLNPLFVNQGNADIALFLKKAAGSKRLSAEKQPGCAYLLNHLGHTFPSGKAAPVKAPGKPESGRLPCRRSSRVTHSGHS